MVNKQLQYSHYPIYHEVKTTRQLMERNVTNIFLPKSCSNESRGLVPDLFYFFKKGLYEIKVSELQLSFNIFDSPKLDMQCKQTV